MAESPFIVYDERFRKLLDSPGSPKLEVLVENATYPFAHEAGVFVQSTNELFVTSARIKDPNTQSQRVQISKVILGDANNAAKQVEIDSSQVTMGNGGVNYGDDGILFCAQGSFHVPSGLYEMKASSPYSTRAVITSFHGRQFNSVNDVVIHSDGTIWFTDPTYGFEQGFRPRPQLPSQVYRYDPKTEDIRAMADGFGHPNGICFSPDEKTVYVTDTDRVHGGGGVDDSKASTIYAFDLNVRHGEPCLENRRLFAFADSSIPDGIKCDMEGNVYSGCGDGINVWSPGGTLIGRILVPEGSANFCFGRLGEIFILNEHRIWRAQLASHVKGALLRI